MDGAPLAAPPPRGGMGEVAWGQTIQLNCPGLEAKEEAKSSHQPVQLQFQEINDATL